MKLFQNSRIFIVIPFFLSMSIFFVACSHQNEPKEIPSPEPVAYQCRFDEKWDLTCANKQTAQTLEDQLIIQPGRYNVSGFNLNINHEGLFRVMFIGKENYQRVVFNNDTLALLSGLSWIITHGNSDNEKSFEELTAKALSDKLYLTCGHASNWIVHTLMKLGIPARVVMTLTLEPWNSYDNGHNMVEVKTGNRWILFDIDNNLYFAKDEKKLDLRQFKDCVESNNYRKHSLSGDIPIEAGWNSSDGYDFTFFSEYNCTGPDALTDWYKKVCQVIFIEKESIMYFPEFADDEINKRIRSYAHNIRSVSSEQFNAIFYNE